MASSTVAATPVRVDLGTPTFSNPAAVTNPLFPKSTQTQVVQLGVEAGDQLRFEVTQLAETRFIRWNGQWIQTRVTHFVAYTNGRLVEVALDFYAQADDGAVWYFGEEVDNYEDGVLANHDGTWLAGRDGPPGMIMPAQPKVGDVYRPENIAPLVFEEATVTAVGLTVDGPRGPITGAIRIQAALLDGSVEEKIYAPGYGEFDALVSAAGEHYSVALGLPIDAQPGALPAHLRSLSKGVADVFAAARSRSWSRVSAIADRMTTVWTKVPSASTPDLLRVQMDTALATLKAAIAGRDRAAVRQAAIDVGHATLDLKSRYLSVETVDEARLKLWKLQLIVDRAARDAGAIAGDRVTIGAIEDRLDD
ncbi:MAG: hypothetical protein ABIQ58_03965 [Candidatus Limnocylindrales bacterium]